MLTNKPIISRKYDLTNEFCYDKMKIRFIVLFLLYLHRNKLNIGVKGGSFMKTKDEFLKAYRDQHPEYIRNLVIWGIFAICAAILVIVGAVMARNANGFTIESLFVIMIGLLCGVVSIVFMKMFQHCDYNGVLEYEKYVTECRVKKEMTDKNS